MYDYAVLQGSEEIKNLSSTYIESDFYKMIGLYSKYSFSETEYLRCTATRRIRKLLSSQQLYGSNWDTNQLEVIKLYLSGNCPGEPSHLSWATKEKNPEFVEDQNKQKSN